MRRSDAMRLMTPFLLATFLSLAGCDAGGPNPQAVEYSPAGPVSAAPQRPGDPEKGRRALLNEPYLGCGMPYSAYRRLNGHGADAAVPRIPDREGRNAELPYFFTAHTTRKGVDLVSSNCLYCHGGSFDGQIVIGLGNENLDFTEDRTMAAETVGAYLGNEAEAAEWRRWADVIRAVAPYEITDTVGANPAINATLILMAHRDPETLAWSQKPLMEPPPPQVAPVSVPPWWRLAKKNALYYNTEGRGDLARAMMLGAIYCADDVATLKAIDAYAPDIRAYFASLRAPRWPFPLDADLARRGRTVFERTCSGCHGTYGEAPGYPNLVVALEEVGTDPALAEHATNGASDRFIAWFNRSWFGETARAAPAKGYIAPPLDGVWVTAPFLHNGSVPNIALLLDSRKRPKYWTRSYGSAAADYDPETLGWRYTERAAGKSGTDDPEARKKIYDTTLPGYSNGGHTYGDGLSEDERRAVLEYLKTL
jgi:mono/diheme cytochrome c family protein